MARPIVFISHFKLKEGKLDAFRANQRETTAQLKADKPRTAAFLLYMSEDARVSVIHVFADSESMDAHFEGAAERARAAYELLEPDGWEIYGTPSHQALSQMRQAAASAGVRLTVQPDYVGGFLRLQPA